MNEYMHPYVAQKQRELEMRVSAMMPALNEFTDFLLEPAWDFMPIAEPMQVEVKMSFKRDESKEGGFRLIPAGTTVPVYVQEVKGKTEAVKSGRSQGRMRDVYALVLRVIGGDFHGSKILDRIWLNIERTADGGSEIHGGHKMWCDLCDILGLAEDGNYTMPNDANQWAQANVYGKAFNITVDEDEYTDNKGKTRTTNRIKDILPISVDQKQAIKGSYKDLMTAIEKEAATKAAESGAAPDLGDDDDDDLPF